MFRKLYAPKDVASSIGHYGASLALYGAAFGMAVAHPWLIGTAVVLTGGLTTLALKANKEIFENHLDEHPKEHIHSPNLGYMVKLLFQQSGIQSETYPVYSFRIQKDHQSDTKNGKKLKAFLREAMKQMRKVPNAAALHLEKPVIMISEPLLALLNDEEEYAVLGHEFAHAAARHQHLAMPQKFISATTRVMNSFLALSEAFSAGVIQFVGTTAAAVFTSNKVEKCHKNSKVIKEEDSDLNIKEIAEKKRIKRNAMIAGQAVAITGFTYFNPHYLTVVAATKVMNAASKMIDASYSQRKEYQADAGAVKLGADPLALITALRKIHTVLKRSRDKAWGRDGEKAPTPNWLVKTWKQVNATHPPQKARIAHLVDLAREKGKTKKEIERAVKGDLDIPDTSDIPYEVLQAMAARFHKDFKRSVQVDTHRVESHARTAVPTPS